jgi:hypothetical protein
LDDETMMENLMKNEAIVLKNQCEDLKNQTKSLGQ